METAVKKIIAIIFLNIQTLAAFAQCIGGGFSGSVTPTTTYQTVCISAGNYITFNAIKGTKYTFSFCQGGGSASYDTQIMINDDPATSVLAYNDDYCGASSHLTYTAAATATYRVLVTEYNCKVNPSCVTMAYKIDVPNDNICAATFLNPSCTSNGYYISSNVGATNSPQANPGCATYSGGDLWFSTIVPFSGSLNITTRANVITDGGMAVYSANSCSGPLTLIQCDDNSGPGNMPQITLTDLTPGDSLFIRFWEKGNDVKGAFDIAVFDNDPFYCMTGSARQLFPTGCLQITPDTRDQKGCVWNKTQIDVSESFDYFFTVNLGNNDGGADGLAFTMQNSPAGMAALGNAGYQLGIAPVPNSLIIEFDTFNNGGGVNDIAEDHTAISINGDIGNPVAGPIQASSTSANIEDGLDHMVRIVWDHTTKTFSVYFDGVLRLTYTGDIINTVFGGDPMVYWGFSGSTGLFTNSQSICPGTLPGAPLPMEWVSFKAEYNNNVVVLNWTSANEVNTSHFIIERSSDGEYFSEIGKLDSDKLASTYGSYQFIDKMPLSGISYYRIKQVDLDGAFTYSGSRTINRIMSVFDLEFYPNPVKASNTCMVKLSGAEDESFILTIMDNLGNIVVNTTINTGTNTITIPEHLKAGIYHTQVRSDNQVINKTVVIEN